jgi:glucose-1-phosphate thymidylyltransferase
MSPRIVAEASHFVQISSSGKAFLPRGDRATLGYISLEAFHKVAQKTAKSSYGEYLMSVFRSFVK